LKIKGLNGRMVLRDGEKEEVIRRTRYECQICGAKKEGSGPMAFPIRLVVHHLRYPPLSFDDLQGICMSCHNKINNLRRRK